MKYPVLFAILLIAAYFGWFHSTKATKRTVKKWTARHFFSVAGILLFVTVLSYLALTTSTVKLF